MQLAGSQLEQKVLRAALQGGLVPGSAPISIPKLLVELQAGILRPSLGPGPAQPSFILERSTDFTAPNTRGHRASAEPRQGG